MPARRRFIALLGALIVVLATVLGWQHHAAGKLRASLAWEQAQAQERTRLLAEQQQLIAHQATEAEIADVLAERAVVALEAHESLKDTPRQYLNRLSDLMFVLARVLNRYRTDGTVGDDVYWKSEKLAKAQAE